MQIAAAYIRVSTEDQTEYSPDAQLRALRRWAAEHDMLLPDGNVYMDEGISGRTAEKRPAFMAMIRAARGRERPFDVILVHKFDRFARSREDSIVFKNLLRRECGVSVVSISESIDDGGSGMGMLIESISEAYAEFYSVNLGREVRKGMTEKARRGGLQAAPAYGYKAENGVLVPVPEEAERIRDIFRRFLSGDGYSAIAKGLNAQGVRTHRGNAFENRTIEYILRNPVYIGKLRWTPTMRCRRDFKNPDTIVSDGAHPSLIDADTFDAAQRRVQEIKLSWGYKARPTYELKDWLSGCVRCAVCGGTLVFIKPNAMLCNNYARGRCTRPQRVPVDVLHEAVLSRLRWDTADAAPLEVAAAHAAAGGVDALEAKEKELRACDSRLSRLRDAYLDGLEDLDAYRRMKAQLDARRQALQADISRLRSQGAPETGGAGLGESLAAALRTLAAPDASLQDKNNAFRAAVSRCTFDRDRKTMEITYKFLF